MKKNISINISGIIFHIEEDGYDQLKKYLDSIARYFSTFEDSSEITSDIEGRIAEIFLSKLTEEKQVITSDDVGELIATMGSIEDFQAIEDGAEAPGEEKQEEYSSTTAEADDTPREFKRDNNRKVLGGVCAGIAAYFNIDPLWIRLLTLVLFLGSYGILLLVYIVLWIVLPSTDTYVENKKMKKMFRNPDKKVIAGVSSGVATYFNIDLTLVRVLFVIFGIWGPGVIAYIILWIILPEANTITEKVQMQGEPVTLSNIESNVKKGLNVREGEKENVLVKILLFPFRLIAAVINGLGKILGPILLFMVDFLRVITGVFLTGMGIMALFVLLVVGGTLIGIFSGGAVLSIQPGELEDISQPIMMFFETIPSFSVVVAFLVSIVPPLFLILLGISIIIKKIVFNATVGWTLFGIFIIGGIYLSVSIPGIAFSLHERASVEEKQSFTITQSSAYLEVDRSRGVANYDEPAITLRGHDGPEFEAIVEFASNGSSRTNAIANAKMVSYNIEQEDSVLTFDNNLTFDDDAVFKFQEIDDITLNIPYNVPFVMDRSMRSLLRYRTMERWGYRRSQVNDENTWMFTEDNGLECLNCERFDIGFEDANRGRIYSRGYDFSDFTSVDVNSPISIDIREGEEFKVEVKGQERYVEDVDVDIDGNTLVLDLNDQEISRRNFSRSRDAIKVVLVMPSIERINLSQASKADIRGFKGGDVQINMSGSSSAEVDIDADRLDVSLNGNSHLRIRGASDELILEANGNSTYEGYSFRSRIAEVEVRGVSEANLYVREQIRIDKDIVSTVKYRGNATEVVVDNNE